MANRYRLGPNLISFKDDYFFFRLLLCNYNNVLLKVPPPETVPKLDPLDEPGLSGADSSDEKQASSWSHWAKDFGGNFKKKMASTYASLQSELAGSGMQLLELKDPKDYVLFVVFTYCLVFTRWKTMTIVHVDSKS